MSPAQAADPGLPLSETTVASPREAAALLVLARSGRLAPGRYAELVETAGSALTVLTRERLAAASQTSLFADPEAELEAELHAAERDIAAWRAQGMRLITVLDHAAYPANLAAAHDRPPLIFVAGRLKPRDERGVAVIGSREPTRPGLGTAKAMAEHLAQTGYTVLSGLASGIDTAAHTAALKRGGRTVAVIGTGLSRCYPRANVILQRRIAAECAVVSQFLPDTPPTRETFPMRNAVMSGLSLATVIIEASATSGTRIQARQALAQGRPLFLFPSLLHHPWASELAELPAVNVVEEPAEVTATLDRLTSTAALVA
jgi:DNA processing protein